MRDGLKLPGRSQNNFCKGNAITANPLHFCFSKKGEKMLVPYIKKPKRKKWLIGLKIKRVEELFYNKWVAVMHDDGEYIVLPSWWARCLTVGKFMKYISKGCLYTVTKNPYRNK